MEVVNWGFLWGWRRFTVGAATLASFLALRIRPPDAAEDRRSFKDYQPKQTERAPLREGQVPREALRGSGGTYVTIDKDRADQ